MANGCNVVDENNNPNKECILEYVDKILSFTAGFVEAQEWNDFADVLLRLKADDEKIYNCTEEVINQFYGFKP